MSKWFRRAVGTVVVAGAVLLLGAGTAPAHVSAPAAMDPRQLQELPADPLGPAGDPNGQDLPPSAPGLTPGMAPDLVPHVPDALRLAVDGPNMIGDDFVDQSPYAGLPPATALDSLPVLDLGLRSPN